MLQSAASKAAGALAAHVLPFQDKWEEQLSIEEYQFASIFNLAPMVLQYFCFPLLPADLAADGHDMHHFEAACHRMGQHLAVMSAARAHTLAQEFELPPPGGSLSAEQAGYRLPTGVIPRLPHPTSEGGGLPAAQSRAMENLGSLLQLPVGASFQEMLAWLELCDWEEQQAVDGVTAMLRLHSVERELFSRCMLKMQYKGGV
eukprot:1156002-Pelagomonas_calceolata.AAC.1